MVKISRKPQDFQRTVWRTRRATLITMMLISTLLVLQTPIMRATTISPASDLGSFSGLSFATDLNDLGQVVGASHDGTTERVFLWTEATGMIDVGIPPNPDGGAIANGISNTGQIVGNIYTSVTSFQSHAFSWTQSGGLLDLGTLGRTSSEALAVNDYGQVVGYSYTRSAGHAFVWDQASGMVDIGTLGGDYSIARGINNVGKVVGESGTPYGNHAFSWTSAGGMIDLNVNFPGFTSSAYAISNTGQIVGSRSDLSNGGLQHAFSWTSAGGVVDLGTLGGEVSVALGVNDAGQVVGYSSLAGDTAFHAFLWTDIDGMIDLGTFSKGDGSGASAINASGHVVGYALLTANPDDLHAALWSLSSTCDVPVIDTEPQTQLITSGQAATLSIEATGTAPTYQWYRGPSGDASNPIVGATSSSYATDALTTKTAYWVRVSNACGSVDSATAVIKVTTSPLTVSIVATAESFKEGTGSSRFATFKAKLSRKSTVPVTVQFATYATEEDTATANVDFVPVTKTLTFAPGTTAQDGKVEIVGDETPERDETFSVRLINAVNASIASGTATGTIADDDKQLVVLVHGICGNTETFDQLGSLLAAHLPHRIVQSFDYSPHSGFDDTTRSSLTSVTTLMAQQIEGWIAQEEEKPTQIAFVTHSMGGVIVRAMMAGIGGSSSGRVTRQVKRVVMIGSPNHGAQPDFPRPPGCVESSEVFHSQLADLAYGSRFIRQITNGWEMPPIAADRVLFIVGCGPHFGDGGECSSDGVVQAANATLPIPSTGPDYYIAHVPGCHVDNQLLCLTGNNIGIADISNETHPSYPLIQSFIRDGRPGPSYLVGTAPGLILVPVMASDGTRLRQVKFSNFVGPTPGEVGVLSCDGWPSGQSEFESHVPSVAATNLFLLTELAASDGPKCWSLGISALGMSQQDRDATVPFGRPVWLAPVLLSR